MSSPSPSVLIAMSNTTVVVPASLAGVKRIRVERFLPRIQPASAQEIRVVDSGAESTNHTSILATIPVAATLLTGALEIGADVDCYSRASVLAKTVTADSTNDTLTSAAHTLGNGCRGIFSSTGTLPGGIEANRVYYIVSVAAGTFKVSLSLGGPVHDITSNGTGTITFTAQIGPQPGFGFKTNIATLDGSLVVTPIG